MNRNDMEFDGTTLAQVKRAYSAGWKASESSPGKGISLDDAEANYVSRGRTSSQQDAWLSGWLDYASDYDYGHTLKNQLGV